MAKSLERVFEKNPVAFAVGGVALVAGVFFVLKYGLTRALRGAAGFLTGNNMITEGTPYEDTGILGTLGAASNEILGGLPEKVGTSVAVQDALRALFSGGTWTGYTYGTLSNGQRGWKSIINLDNGDVWEVDANGNRTRKLGNAND